ncbi:MAG: hypothetical protein ABI680_08310 [Chthoniobacteraceae bacterium]
MMTKTLAVLLLILGLICAAPAHDGLDLLPPITAPDAWNVLRLCEANMVKLVAEKAWKELTPQLALSTEAIQFLQTSGGEDASGHEHLDTALKAAATLDQVSRNGDGTAIQQALKSYQSKLAAAAADFDPKVVKADVFSCPMCKDIRELDPKARCSNVA